ncbi:DNA-binding response regulator [Aliivibrio sp. 1S165]|uniref:response regulator transcription factor n=1 Tax=unclassified Aliivibrio TaxID=2645654 RepID=UPI00080E7A14|nr:MULTISPECIES: response regulator transcription factor [unclassified Aliivibrio]OCH15313.1 DNA-binding response regulator [Aliivibrio sp. 1S165]OCH34318.1 DNA-binding response regulator [Aliivibrio sp. 1S175]
MKKGKILIVEDDQEIGRLTQMYLEAEQYNTKIINDGSLAIDAIKDYQPDLLLLDLMLPGKNGANICREARQFYHGMILILTASDDEMSEVSLFKFGADDYVTKPVRGHILLARIEALLRRSPSSPLKTTNFLATNIILESNTQTAWYKNSNLELTTAEFEILHVLMDNVGKVVTREKCCKAFRGIDYDFNDRSIDMRVSGLRKKLSANNSPSNLIRTIRNRGYMLVSL